MTSKPVIRAIFFVFAVMMFSPGLHADNNSCWEKEEIMKSVELRYGVRQGLMLHLREEQIGKTEYFLVVSRIGGAAGVDRESKTPWVLLERKNNSGCLIDSGKYIVSLRSLHDVTMFDEENMTDGFLRKMSCSGNITEKTAGKLRYALNRNLGRSSVFSLLGDDEMDSRYVFMMDDSVIQWSMVKHLEDGSNCLWGKGGIVEVEPGKSS
ncbi:hypothetical protein [Alloalcanivorax venustensis]|jgi:hypothetical protein|uniref:hypothetical protein n=1 Tax=Alloalcanivorax venustensis TaxID=172371 RepID=UPI003259F39B|tara:strand:+ start:869 stop:1495 length:627 start_codon:yes stop_codon:yes gene_type:complete